MLTILQSLKKSECIILEPDTTLHDAIRITVSKSNPDVKVSGFVRLADLQLNPKLLQIETAILLARLQELQND